MEIKKESFEGRRRRRAFVAAKLTARALSLAFCVTASVPDYDAGEIGDEKRRTEMRTVLGLT